jgi:transcriptional regulator with XRE-family HTH domain
MYNLYCDDNPRKCIMGKRNTKPSVNFGEKIALLRKNAVLSQRELAAEQGISQRRVAYYEKHTETFPAHLLTPLAKTLSVSPDQILNAENATVPGKTPDSGLWRRFKEVEKLPPKERRQIIKLLNTFIEKEKLQQAL